MYRRSLAAGLYRKVCWHGGAAPGRESRSCGCVGFWKETPGRFAAWPADRLRGSQS